MPSNIYNKLNLKVEKEAIYVINIYNYQGIKVNQIHEGILNSGEHQFTWELNDGLNVPVQNGLYYYTISCDGKTKYQKFIVNR